MKKMKKRLDRRPKNPIEAKCYDELHAKGYTLVTKRGMPDFLAIKDNKLILVECKKDGQKLSNAQFLLFKYLSKYNILCYYYTPSKGLQEFMDLRERRER